MVWKRALAPFVVTGLLLLAVSATAAPGDLDPAFQGGGLARSPLGTTVTAGAVAPDGKIVVGGDVLARYNADGSPDTSFGPNGTGAIAERVGRLTVQPDGKVVISRNYYDSCESIGLELSRFDTTGALDGSFGSGGRVRLPLGGPSSCFALLSAGAGPVAVAPDGKLVVSGYKQGRGTGDTSIVLARYLPDGSFDPAFNSGEPVEGPRGDARALLLLPDGRLVVGGQVRERGELSFGLARYLPDGAPDATFDGDGAVQTLVGTGGIAGLALQPDGRIVAAGEGYERKIVLIRYAEDGSIDPSFGADGRAITAFPGSAPVLGIVPPPGIALALQPGGGLVARGQATFNVVGGPPETTFALARYTPDGRLDPGFGACGGVVTWPAPVSEGARVVLPFGSDRVLAIGGASAAEGEPGIAIASYQAGTGTPAECPDPFTPTTTPPPADMSLAIADAPARVALDLPFDLTVVIRNEGPSPAPGAYIHVPRGSALRLAATESATPGRRIDVGTLAPGEGKTVPLKGSVEGTPRTPLAVELDAVSNKRDPEEGNDVAVLRLRLIGYPVRVAGKPLIARRAHGRTTTRVRITCPASERTCTGRLRLLTRREYVLRLPGRARRIAMGRADFRLRGGERRRVRVRIPAAGRRLLRNRRSVAVEATATSRDPAAGTRRATATRPLRLRCPASPGC
jgi:uncharacterized delta-60 repeat protein